MSATSGTGTISQPPGTVAPPPEKEQGQAPAAGSNALAKWVFWPAAATIIVFVLFATIFPGAATEAFTAIQGNVIKWFGWYYVAAVALFVVFSLWIGLSRYGDIKLGKDEDEPDFSVMSWFALLFAAGMGIGLVFFGVAEPLNHFASPRPGVEGTPLDLAQHAMTQTYLHWGLHAWAIYVVVGVSIAYAVHRRNRPISIRWALEPLLGHKRVSGAWGNLIDIVALVGTLFGVATSLGLGVLQISSGLDEANILEATTLTQIGLILCIITLTIVSVVSGVGRGMKWLSNINLVLAALLMLVVLFTGPTLFLLREFIQSIGNYLQNVVGLTFNTLAFSGAEGEAWQAAWTTFYWGWWISWAPFVGIFIARISKGRTVRQFVAGVLLVPTTLGFLWFSVLGGAAIHRELFGTGGLISDDGSVDTEGALFNLLGELPGGLILTVGAVLLISIFFITSADSGALVMGMISTGGNPEPKNWLRIFWALSAAAVAIALLLANGLQAIQTAAILTAVPFSLVLILMCISTAKAFHLEHEKFMRVQRRLAREEMTAHVTEQMQDTMHDSVQEHYQEHVAEQIHDSVQEHYQEHLADQVHDSVQEHYQEHLADQVQDQVSEAVEAQLNELRGTQDVAGSAPAAGAKGENGSRK